MRERFEPDRSDGYGMGRLDREAMGVIQGDASAEEDGAIGKSGEG